MHKKVIFIGLGIFLILLLIGGYAANKVYTQPQAPTLSLPGAAKEVVSISSATPTEPQLLPTKLPAVESKKTVTPQKPAIPTIVPTKVQPVCGQTGIWTVLVLARAIDTDTAELQSIRLAKVDFDKKQVLVYTLPPELALDTPGLPTDYKIQYSYLAQLFSRILNVIGESPDANLKATEGVAQVIFDNFGIAVDHYVTFDNNLVIEAVDAIGGIHVVLPEDFTVLEELIYQGEALEAGRQHFDGEMLQAYVSVSGVPGDDLGRLMRQNVALEGMRKKLLNPLIILKINDLYQLYKEHIDTDLSLEQMVSLGCLARLVQRDQIVMKEPTIEEILYWEDGSMHFKDLEVTAQQLQELFGVTGP